VLGTVHRISITTATPTQPARFSQRYLFTSSRNLNVTLVNIIWFIATAVGMSDPFQKDSKKVSKRTAGPKARINTKVYCTCLHNVVLLDKFQEFWNSERKQQ